MNAFEGCPSSLLLVPIPTKLIGWIRLRQDMGKPDTLMTFCRDCLVSYQQAIKYKEWLKSWGLIEVNKQGKHDNLTLTSVGLRLSDLVASFVSGVTQLDEDLKVTK